MRVLSKSTLRDYWENHTDCEQQLLSWYQTTKKANWSSFDELKHDLGSAQNLGEGRVKIKIKGNSYRLIIRVNYAAKMVFVRFIGTHAEYDKIDAKKV